jgi:hypothetical protein
MRFIVKSAFVVFAIFLFLFLFPRFEGCEYGALFFLKPQTVSSDSGCHFEPRLVVVVIAGGNLTRFVLERQIWSVMAEQAEKLGVQVYFTRMNPSLMNGQLRRTGRLLEFGGPDGDVSCHLHSTVKAWKTIMSEKLCGWKTNLFLRTNLSSYWDFRKLLQWLDGLKQVTKVYAGYVGFDYSQPFASGAGFILSRDLVANIVKRSSKLRFEKIDDVAIGYFFSNVQIIPMKRCDIFTKNQELSEENFLIPSDWCPSSTFHWRVKSPTEKYSMIFHAMLFFRNHTSDFF